MAGVSRGTLVRERFSSHKRMDAEDLKDVDWAILVDLIQINIGIRFRSVLCILGLGSKILFSDEFYFLR